MMTEPVVSVLLTSHNRERYIGPAIESVLASWFADFELIVMDDASTDGTVAVAREYASTDRRVRVIANADRVGQFANRNRAAREARGTLMRYHDSDDLMYPHCLAVIVPLMLAEPRAVFGLSMSRAYSGGPVPMLLTPKQCYEREFLGTGMFGEGPSAGIFRREGFLSLGGFPEKGVASDTLFWLHAAARVNVLALPGDLYWYRRHPGQELASPHSADEYRRAIGQIWSVLSDPVCPLSGEALVLARRTLAVRLVRSVLGDLRNGRITEAYRRLSLSGIPLRQILRHAVPHQHSFMAGTPLSAEGEYLVPDWRAFGASAVPQSEIDA